MNRLRARPGACVAALVDLDRVRLAVEDAARQNLEQFIAETSKLRLA